MRCRGLEDRGSVLDGPADVPCFALYINVMRKNERTPLDPRRLFCLRVWRYWTSVLLVLSKPQTGRKVKSYCELPFCLFRGCHILQLFSLFSPMCLGYPKLVGTVFWKYPGEILIFAPQNSYQIVTLLDPLSA